MHSIETNPMLAEQENAIREIEWMGNKIKIKKNEIPSFFNNMQEHINSYFNIKPKESTNS